MLWFDAPAAEASPEARARNRFIQLTPPGYSQFVSSIFQTPQGQSQWFASTPLDFPSAHARCFGDRTRRAPDNGQTNGYPWTTGHAPQNPKRKLSIKTPTATRTNNNPADPRVVLLPRDRPLRERTRYPNDTFHKTPEPPIGTTHATPHIAAWCHCPQPSAGEPQHDPRIHEEDRQGTHTNRTLRHKICPPTNISATFFAPPLFRREPRRTHASWSSALNLHANTRESDTQNRGHAPQPYEALCSEPPDRLPIKTQQSSARKRQVKTQ